MNALAKAISYFMRAVNWVIVMSACAVILLYLGKQDFATQFIKALADIPYWFWIATAAAIFFLDGMALLSLLRPARYQNYISYKNPKGKMVLSVSALQEALVRALLSQPGVHDMRVQILVPKEKARKKKPIRVIASGTLWEAEDILTTQTRLQNFLEQRFSGILRTDEKVEYDVRLERFRFEKPSKKVPPQEKEDIYETGFRGPQYPIEE